MLVTRMRLGWSSGRRLVLLLLWRRYCRLGIDKGDVGIETTGNYQIDDAARSLQNANGRLVWYCRFQNLTVDRQDLISFAQSTISVTDNNK